MLSPEEWAPDVPEAATSRGRENALPRALRENGALEPAEVEAERLEAEVSLKFLVVVALYRE